MKTTRDEDRKRFDGDEVPESDFKFSFARKLLVIRLARLGHLPPAQYAAEILHERGFPCLIVEFGKIKEDVDRLLSPFPRLRLSNRWVAGLPKKFRVVGLFLGTLVQLIYRVLRDGRPNLLILHGLQEKCLGLILHFLFRIPMVVHEHEVYELEELTGANRFFFRLGITALRKSEFILFPEVTRAQIYKDRYAIETPIYFVFNCPRRGEVRSSAADLRKRLNLPRESILMTYFGGVGSSNAMEEAIAGLLETPSVYFLIWGWGHPDYVNSLKELARKLGVINRVLFLGIWEDKWDFIGNCDISYCVYRPEVLRLKHAATASNKLMESIAAGIPVITSNEPDFRGIVEGYDVGVCLDKISSSAVAAALKGLVGNEVLRKRKSANGIKIYHQRFNYENQFEPVVEHFQKFFEPAIAEAKKLAAKKS